MSKKKKNKGISQPRAKVPEIPEHPRLHSLVQYGTSPRLITLKRISVFVRTAMITPAYLQSTIPIYEKTWRVNVPTCLLTPVSLI